MHQSPYHFSFEENSSIVDIVDSVIDKANKNAASDIHIDPRPDDVRIRFRIDGVLHDVCRLSKENYSEFIARVKIISGLRIDEKIIPQDGRFSFGKDLDVRVTIIASYFGESVVFRLLRRNSKIQSLIELGFSKNEVEEISKTLHNKQGLILVTGPTGSGKTTTLYSLLSIVNKSSVSTVTIEDPVEYAMEHARQIQVQQKRGINFVNGLRSILRQDPDVIMVGEIRDHETAAIATSAALTGHLVFSTLHTNDAISTVTRAVEMGIEPYLVAATLKLAISQRLVRKLCLKCRALSQISEKEKLFVRRHCLLPIGNATEMVNNDSFLIYVAKGCESCNGTGYSGRTVVSEILPITRQLEAEVSKNSKISEERLFEQKTIYHQAIMKYIQGITSFEEVINVLN